MSQTAIRNLQIKNNTITLAKLVPDFLNGVNWNITNGANNATITGLAEGLNPRDAVTKSQLDALAATVSGGLVYRSGLAAGANLSGNTTGNTYLDGGNGLVTGDFFFVTSSGNITDGVNSLAVNAGDMLIANKDVGADASINVLTDFDKIDNTEAADILRVADIVDNVTTADATKPLSANQGKLLNDRVLALEAFGIPVYGEILAVTNGNAAVGAMTNPPVVGTEEVYLNGIRQERGAGCDYQINNTTGVITFEFTLQADDKVMVDYRR